MKVRKSDLMLIFFWILCLESITSIIKNNILSNIVQFILLFIIAYICISQRKKINLNICGIWKTYCMLIALMILPDIINLNIKSGFRYIMPFVFRLVTRTNNGKGDSINPRFGRSFLFNRRHYYKNRKKKLASRI